MKVLDRAERHWECYLGPGGLQIDDESLIVIFDRSGRVQEVTIEQGWQGSAVCPAASLSPSGHVHLELVWKENWRPEDRFGRRFLDFVVDGASVDELLADHDHASCLGWSSAPEDRACAARLLGDAPPDVEDRVAVWVCLICGETECGAITIRLTREDDEVVWRKPAFSWPDYGEDPPIWRHELRSFGDRRELRFDAVQYRTAIEQRPLTSLPTGAPYRKEERLAAVRRKMARVRRDHRPRCEFCGRPTEPDRDRCPGCDRLLRVG